MHRERDEAEVAATIERESLAPLLDAARAAGESAAAIDARLVSVFLTESERVANAFLIAELVRAQLPALTPAEKNILPVPEPRSVAREIFPATPSPSRSAPRDIADFIDEMLAQDTTARPPTAARRGS